MKKETLDRAMLRLKQGDESAFDYVYDNTYKVVYFTAHSILRDRQSAEDVMQEVYVKALGSIGSYSDGNALAWLTTIARRLAINEYNKRKREVPTEFDETSMGSATLPEDDEIGLLSLAEEVLSEEEFKIVVMCAVAGYKRREVAKLLDLPTSTVTYKYQEALKTLRKKLEGGSDE